MGGKISFSFFSHWAYSLGEKQLLIKQSRTIVSHCTVKEKEMVPITWVGVGRKGLPT